jgi:hypothetical protein
VPQWGPDGEAIVSRLSADISRLAVDETRTIAEFHTAKVTVWQVWPDDCGIPRVWSESRTWDSLLDRGLFDERALLAFIRPDGDGRLLLARTGTPSPPFSAVADADRAFAAARRAHPDAVTFSCETSVDDLLGEATARVPLPASVWYELVLLSRTRTGRIEFTAQQLFLPEAVRGDTRTFDIRCEASDENGTAFAVAARNEAFEFRLLSLQSARVQPGTYRVTAKLLRPGRVSLHGLPVKPRDDPRSWLDVRAAVPERLDAVVPAHLIVAVEVCGPQRELHARVDRARQLAGDLAAGTGAELHYSLLTYGAHLHERREADEPVRVLSWAEPDARQLSRGLDDLDARGPVDSGPARGAQIECLLHELAERLGKPEAGSAGRPVLVTIGGRPSSPSRIDPATRIFPCPHRRDWRGLQQTLSRARGMTFGAIRDGDDSDDQSGYNPADEVWRTLGSEAYARVGTFNPRPFAVGLGLASPTMQYLPFPLAVPERAE